MVKYKSKRRQRRTNRRTAHGVSLSRIDYVTNWSGVKLDPIVRNLVKVGDTVRVIINDELPIYVEIRINLGGTPAFLYYSVI